LFQSRANSSETELLRNGDEYEAGLCDQWFSGQWERRISSAIRLHSLTFKTKGKTLLIVCEEGENEYEERTPAEHEYHELELIDR
jgi:hypothetical protein